MNIINPQTEFKTMPVLDVKNKASLKMHLENAPETIYTTEQLDSIHRAIRYTQAHKHEESMAKMDEEEMIERQLPKPLFNKITDI